eukprot:NODE_282_length_10822_cov_1.088035.p7 type:complete len:115 gc:universal NODE_282_length_10822_cov_1.088035:8983-9327(+)
MLDGSTSHEVRQDLIDSFNQDDKIKVFLLSTRAGSLGINLTAANVVIIFDLDINPNIDQQAEDRAWRMGQLRTVRVYRLICKNTIEENFILKKRELKNEMSRQVEAHVDNKPNN